MRGPITWLGTAAVSAFLIVAAVAYGAEKKILLADVPKPVMDAAKARFKDAVMTDATKEETDDGKVVYEVSLTVKGKTIDVLLAPEGKILVFAKVIVAKDLPKPVAKILEKNYPKATYKCLEQVFNVENGKEKLDFYEALLVTAEKEDLEVHVTADGEILIERVADPE